MIPKPQKARFKARLSIGIQTGPWNFEICATNFRPYCEYVVNLFTSVFLQVLS